MNYLILTTGRGNRFARKITRELRRLGNTTYIYRGSSINFAFRNHPEWTPENLIIHARTAFPVMTDFRAIENRGFRSQTKKI